MSNEIAVENNVNIGQANNMGNVTYEKQKSFLETNLGQVINGGINLGLRAILPDFIEDEIIEIKDSIITDGFSAGIKTAIDNVIDLGKSVVGVFTGKFENMSQVNNVIKKGGLIDSVSDALDWGIKKAREGDVISKEVATIINKGKNAVLNAVNSSIENNLTTQVESIDKVDRYITNWKAYYNNQDFNSMEKEYKKMEKELQNIVPLESVLNKARQVENLHELIKNNGKNFELSPETLELANKLV